MTREREPKKEKLAQLGAQIDELDVKIEEEGQKIAEANSQKWHCEGMKRQYEKLRNTALAKFALQAGLVKQRVAPAPNGVVAEGDPLTEEELAQVDAAIEAAAAPEPVESVEVPF